MADKIPLRGEYTGTVITGLAEFQTGTPNETVGIAFGGTSADNAPQALINLIGAPTKGRLVVADGSNWIVFDVGADGTVLTANSATSEGVQWSAAAAGGFAYTTINGDAGTALATSATDTLNLVGAVNGGIATVAADGAPDSVTFALDVADLAAGVGPLDLIDEIAVNDGGTTVKYSFTDVVQDLDIVYGITTNGIIVRTADDTYASRTIVASTVAGDEGISVVNGDGVAGNPEIGVDITGQTASANDMVATDEFLGFDGANNVKFTGQQIADGISVILGGLGNAYTTMTGDTGSVTAASSTDTLNFTGVGITTTATEGAPDSISLNLDIADLPAGVGPLVLGDEIAVNDGGTTLRFTLTDLVQDLDIVYGITTNGIIVRTADDTYASRTIVASTVAGDEGISVVNGDGVAGNPEIGVDITGQAASANDMVATDEFLGFDGANNVKFTGQQIADGISSIIGSLGNAYTTINGDTGSAVAASSTDTLNLVGAVNGGIVTVAADGAPDNVTFALDIADLTAGVGPLVLGDEIAVNDGGTTLRFTFTDLVQDLDIVYGITANGIIVRTADDTYASRTIVASTVAGDEGISVVNGDGVAGNPEIGVDITGQVASANDMVATDEFLGFDGANNVKFTGQQIADGVSLILGGLGNAYTTITGDTGSATASTSTDTLNFTGVGITTSVADGVPDSVSLNLDIADLPAGVGPLVLGDEIAVNDGGTTLRFTLTDLVQDLDIVYGITTNGIIVRTADDTYASRSIVASTDEDNLGASVVNGDGVAGNPTVGVTIVTLTDPGADMAADDEFIIHDKSEGTGGANRKITGQNIADGVGTLLGSTFASTAFTTIVTPAGGPVVADTTADTLTLTQSTGISITGTALTDTINIAPANDLAAVEALATTGLAVRTGVETWTTRTVVASTVAGDEGISVVNGDGVAGNPEIGVDITGQAASANDMVATDEFLGFDGANNVKFTGQQIADGVSTLLGGLGNAYTTITGDTGSATAATSTDTLNFTGVGITTSVADGAPDSVTLNLDIADLPAGVGPLVLTDEIAVNDGGTTLRFTFTDVVQDLDIVYGITTNGIVVRTADDTYASRSIVASTDEDNLGASVVNGDGVAGNPTVGVTIVTLTDPGADMAAADEFIVHDKSEGTGGANRKITGQNIADGVSTIIGIPAGLTVSTINGQPIVTYTDTTRGNKTLSVESHPYHWADNAASDGDWIDIGDADNTDVGIIMPLNGTIVMATGHTEDANSNTFDMRLYIDGTDTLSLGTLTGAGEDSFTSTTLNTDFTQGQKLRVRADRTAGAGSLGDLTIIVIVRWRA